MAEHDQLPYIVIERHSGGVAPFLWGLLLGAGAALLLAPRSGEETQAEIRDRARRIREAAEDRVDDVRDSVADRVSRTRDQLHDRIDSVRDAVDGGLRKAEDAGAELRRMVEHAGDEFRPARPAQEGGRGVTDVDVEEAEGRPGLG